MRPDQITAEAWLDEAARLRPLVRAVVRDDHLADDVLQETWLAASRSSVVGSLTAAARHAWLRTVARRLASRTAGRSARASDLEEQAARPEALTPDERPEVLDELRTVLEVLRDMSPKTREAVCLRYLDGLDPGAVAARLECPESTARVRVHRGLAELRERLSARHGVRAPAVFSLLGRWAENAAPSPVGSGAATRGDGFPLGGAAVAVAALVAIVGVAALMRPTERAAGQAALGLAATDDSGLAAPTPLATTDSERTSTAAISGASVLDATRGTVTRELHVVAADTLEPVVGATVEGWLDGDERAATYVALDTDAEGRAILTYAKTTSSAVALEVRAPGRAPEFVSLDREALAAMPVVTTVALAPGSAVGGSVVDESGLPVASALVHIERQRTGLMPTPHFPDAPGLATRTDGTGRWQLDAIDLDAAADRPGGRLVLRIEHPAHATWTGSFAPYGRDYAGVRRALLANRFDVALADRDGPLVRVVDGLGEPVEGASVCAARRARAPRGARMRAVTDADGEAILMSLADRRPLRVDAPGYASAILREDARGPAPWTVVLQPGRTVHGRVVDETGQPLDGVAVAVWPWPEFEGTGSALRTATDGTFRFEHLPPSMVRLDAIAPSYTTEAVDVDAAQSSVVLRLVGRGRIYGHVVDTAGAPVRGARVEFKAQSAQGWRTASGTSAADGSFDAVAPALESGDEVEVRAVKSGYMARQTAVVDGTSAAAPVELTLVPADDARLRVFGPTGAPLVGVEVTFTGMPEARLAADRGLRPSRWLERAVTDADGTVTTGRRTGEVLAVVDTGACFAVAMVDLADDVDDRLDCSEWAHVRLDLGGSVGRAARIAIALDDAALIHAGLIAVAPPTVRDELGSVELRLPPGSGHLEVEFLRRIPGGGAPHRSDSVVYIRDGSNSSRAYAIERTARLPYQLDAGAVVDLGRP